jgi:hypothetical protein
MMKIGTATLLTVAVALLASAESVAAQCAMCRTALSSPEGRLLAGAIRRGILVLLAAPFLLFGAVAVLAIRARRRHETGAGG